KERGGRDAALLPGAGGRAGGRQGRATGTEAARDLPSAPPQGESCAGEPGVGAGGRGAAAEIGSQELTQLEADCTALVRNQSSESLLQTSLVPDDQALQGYNVREPVYMASQLPSMVEVVAPSDLSEGYVFDAVENGQTFSVTVPVGGVSRGQTFSAPFVPWRTRSDASSAYVAPMFRWKDGLCDCFKFGCSVAHLVGLPVKSSLSSREFENSEHHSPALLGQVQNRLGLNWRGERANPGDHSPFQVLLGIWMFALLNVLIRSLSAYLHSIDDRTGLPNDALLAIYLVHIYRAFSIAFGVFSINVILKTRLHIRERSGIRETICSGCEDLCCATFCQPCTVMQMARHTAHYEMCAAKCYSKTGLSVDAPQLQFGGTEIAPSDHIAYFLDHVSPSSAASRLHQACSTTLREHFYTVIADTKPDHLGVLSSLLSSHMSYPLIAMNNRSDPRNLLPNDIFDISLCRKLLLPIYLLPEDGRVCTCTAIHDDMGRHVFNCLKNSKKGAHDYIRDGLKKILPKILATAEYILPATTELPTEQTDMALGFPDKKPFDESFQPTPLLSATALLCPLQTVGLDVVIPSTPQLSSPHNSIDVIEKVSANAEVHHQSYERQKLRRNGNRSEGFAIIGELLSEGHVLIPFAVDGYGGLGPMAQRFLFGERPRRALTYLPS
ncbi:hypothetical protein THAOC_11124, partial [Thalassiosira oceanica]